VKQKRTYKRFNLVAFLAILGCVGMLLFECIFIFELYGRLPFDPETSIPAQPMPPVTPAPTESPVIPAKPVEPVRRELAEPVEAPVAPAAPAEVPPAEIETAPAAAPVG
jgi:type IV secretory pathway VirB10-like protein